MKLASYNIIASSYVNVYSEMFVWIFCIKITTVASYFYKHTRVWSRLRVRLHMHMRAYMAACYLNTPSCVITAPPPPRMSHRCDTLVLQTFDMRVR